MSATRPATTMISMTDARADLLLTVADALQTGLPLHPLVARDAVQAFRDLADEHTRRADVQRERAERPVGVTW